MSQYIAGSEEAKRCMLRRKELRAYAQDPSVAKSGFEKSERIDLGLALLEFHALPGVSYSLEEIAVWCGCTESAIIQIEQRALRKLRVFLRFRARRLRADLASEFYDRRSPASRERIAA